MIEDKSKTFEEIFNEWYKKFLEEETGMNEKIKKAKRQREEELSKAREEAKETIKRAETGPNTPEGQSILHNRAAP